MSEPVKRETVEGFDDSGFSRWRTFQEHGELSGELPACYELAIGKEASSIQAVVYGGGTVEEQQRGKDYARGGSHKKELFEKAKAAGLNVYIRTIKFATEDDAFLYEQKMLKTFDYAWNKRDQKNPNTREIDEILSASKQKKNVKVALCDLDDADLQRIANEKGKRRESDRNRLYEKRLAKAEADPASMDREIKPRFLKFKKGQQYDATKPLEEQLDMRNRLNKLYVERMKERDPEKLKARASVDDVHRMTTRSKAAAAQTAPKSAKAQAKVSAAATTTTTTAPSATKPLKADGTADMRFKANREAAKTAPSHHSPPVASSSSTSSSKSFFSSSTSGPTKKDGTPDMRYASNRSSSSSYGGGYGSGGGGGYGGGGGGGPLTKSGLPDMRYKANR